MEAIDRKNVIIAEIDSKLNAKIAERVRVPEERVIA